MSSEVEKIDKNLIKMEESECNDETPMWFNSQLFTVNGAPLKFYLIGYSQFECYEKIKIIEAYGGVLSKPETPGTFVFCEPNCSVGENKYERYSIEYFHDSIIALKLQDLIDYKVNISINKDITSGVMEHESKTLKKEEENAEESIDAKPHDKQKNDLKSKNRIDSCPSAPDKPNQLKKVQNSRARIKPTGHLNAFKSSPVVDRLDPRIRDCFVKLERLTDHQIKNTNKDLQTNNRDDDNHEEIDEKNQKYSKGKNGKSAEDGKDSEYLEIALSSDDDDDDDDPASRSYLTRSGKQKSRVIGREPRFTEGDNKKIIKWLIKKNFMPTNTGREIWKQLLKEKVLPDRHFTVFNLIKHFNKNLKHHPDFRGFLKNLRTSRRILTSETVRRPRYTEMENRVMIEYLIENDAIDRANDSAIWQECLKDCKASLNPLRTVSNLFKHFQDRLRYNYAKYTDDPGALREFKKINLFRSKKFIESINID